MAWACAVCRFPNRQILQALATRKEIWQSARPQASANTLQAPGLPEQKELQPEVLSSLALQRLREFPAQELANTLWAFAAVLVFDVPQVDVMEALTPRLATVPSIFRPTELSSTLWACAVLEVSDRPLWKELSAAAREATSEFTAQGLSNTVWALATVRWQDTPMLASIACRAQPLLPLFSPQAIANTTWAFA